MFDLLVAGLALGAIYCLAALGFVMVHNATGAINFAHGDLVVLGGLVGAAAASAWGLPPFLVVVLVPLAMMPLGLLLDVAAFRPVRSHSFASVFTLSLALSIIISSSLLIVLGPEPRKLEPLHAGRIVVGPVATTWQNALMVLVTAALVALQWWLFQRTFLGYQLRATAQDPLAARLMGIRLNRMTALTFALATAYAGVAGVLLAPTLFLTNETGSVLMLKIYVAVVIGGFGSVA